MGKITRFQPAVPRAKPVGSPPASLPHKRQFNKKARIAITRMRWSYFTYF
jgi:hypothetical protein